MEDRRQEILDAALAIADERGIEAISMRAVAERVGVTPMALYPHIGGKAGLLDGLVGRILGQLSMPDADAPWHERLGGIAQALRTIAKQHPSAVALLFSRPSVTPDAVLAVDAIYQELLEAGVPPEQVPRVERMASTLIIGYAVSEVGGRFGTGTVNARGRRARMTEAELPGHYAIAEWLDDQPDWDAEFKADLADLRRLIEWTAKD
jgi:AcrR family transcriptional regulator